MIEKRQIRTVADVEAFLRYAIGELGIGWEFHPDNDFSSYGKPDKDEALLSEEDADKLNEMIDRCFEVCDKQHKDIYHIALQLQIKIDEEKGA